ncbi:MAG: hydrogenase maturation protease [Acidobacteria bacterium]|nr:hydrogenase maturation protease [Acidobacteriota bacterium]
MHAGHGRGTLILGIGNLLMGDEGVGVHAARQLEQADLPPGVTVLDGGTGGFHLLSCLREYGTVVMIDAVMDGRAPGTLSVLRPRFAADFPRVLSAHDIGLRDVIETAALLGPLPAIILITVSIAGMQSMSVHLSPEVAASLPRITRHIRQHFGVGPTQLIDCQ